MTVGLYLCKWINVNSGGEGNDRGKSDAASGFHVLAEGCAPAHTHAHPKLLSIHHESGFPLLYSLLFCLPMSGGRMQLERMLQPHVDPPVSTSPASEVKANSFLLLINHLVCGLLQQQHKADEDRTLWRLLPIFLHTDSCSLNCSNVLQEQLARSSWTVHRSTSHPLRDLSYTGTHTLPRTCMMRAITYNTQDKEYINVYPQEMDYVSMLLKVIIGSSCVKLSNKYPVL